MGKAPNNRKGKKMTTKFYATESTLTGMTSTIHARIEGNYGKTLCGRNATFNYLVSQHEAVTIMTFAKMRAEKSIYTNDVELVSCLRCENAMIKAGA